MTGENDASSRYMTHPYLRRRWDAVGRKLAFSADDPEGLEAWRRETLAKLKDLTGFDTMLGAPLDPVVTEEQDFGDHVRQRVEIQTEPGVIMTLYVLIPGGAEGPHPAVIAAHGHGSGGKYAVAGCREMPEVAETIRIHNYDYGVQLVRAGFIAFCPDARGFGERQEQGAKGEVLASSCRLINNMAYPLGQTITGMWAWDLRGLVDYIETRGDCAKGGIGCAGLSGGGLQTLWASAFEPRITCSVISGYLYGYRESLLDLHGNCSCNYVPHLYEYVDIGEVAALIAPRPLLIETGNRDPLNGASGLDNVYPQVETIRQAYRVLGAEDLVYHDVFEGEHRWNGLEAIPWMQRFVAGKV